MITPKFSMRQDDLFLFISIQAPYTKVADTEIEVNEDDVRFYSAPYYLRLHLPGKVRETDDSSCKFMGDLYELKLEKVTPSEFFPNLDLITSFLLPKECKKRSKPLIEVIGSEDDSSFQNLSEEIDEEEWFIEQIVPDDQPAAALLNRYKYGFGNSHEGLGTKYEVQLAEVAEIKNPDSVSLLERQKQKETKEQQQFSDDHYLCDLITNDDIYRLVSFKFDKSTLSCLTGENNTQLKDLVNREFLFDKLWTKKTYFGLVDILFAYCYDWRVNEGSHNIESPWNISRLSGTLSWFVAFDSVKDVVISSLRRSLCYPLYRHWDLSMKVFKDVGKVLKSGPTGILICLLDIRQLFNQKDPYYLLNQLYVEDYCVWIQSIQPTNLTTILSALKKTLSEVEKKDIDLDLVELELAAKLVEDEEMEEEFSADMEKVRI